MIKIFWGGKDKNKRKRVILRENKLRCNIGNIENYMNFSISKLTRLYITLTLRLFAFNFATPVNQALGREARTLVSSG